jgi:regulation of enolase protein 1 (concanavalin A-like superfamily)
LTAAEQVPWNVGSWTQPPVSATVTADGLVVEAREGSDAWLETYYGFTHDNEHALLVPARVPAGYEVTFLLNYRRRYDQAGIMIRSGSRQWIKAGVEITDGVPHAGAVVTNERGSDWSVAPVPDWTGTEVTVRASLDQGAVILRARSGSDPWQFLRLAPLPSGDELAIGPLICAPEGPGLTVTFSRFAIGACDPQLHLEER